MRLTAVLVPKHWYRIGFLAAAGTLAMPAGLSADWPNFRGPRHDGISEETGFETVWKKPIPMVWEHKIGPAFSSFAVVGDRAFTCGTVDKQQVILALDANSGKVLWQKNFEKEYKERMGGDGTRATPTVDGDRVYIVGAKGTLLCLSTADGKELWRKEFKHEPQWGYSGSVLIEGELAITTGGKSDGALVAFDKKSGAEKWKAGEDPAGYATPYPFVFEGKRFVVGFTGTSAIIAEPQTGRVAVRIPWKTDWEVNAAAPIYHERHLFLTSGYDTGSALYKLRLEGDKLAAEEVWRNKSILAKFQSAILHQGKLYCSDQKALVCLDFFDGKEHWRKPRIANGTMVVADNHLMVLTEKGQLQIAKASPDGYEPLTEAEILSGKCWTVPVLDRGKLYVRDMDRLACFDLRK